MAGCRRAAAAAALPPVATGSTTDADGRPGHHQMVVTGLLHRAKVFSPKLCALSLLRDLCASERVRIGTETTYNTGHLLGGDRHETG